MPAAVFTTPPMVRMPRVNHFCAARRALNVRADLKKQIIPFLRVNVDKLQMRYLVFAVPALRSVRENVGEMISLAPVYPDWLMWET